MLDYVGTLTIGGTIAVLLAAVVTTMTAGLRSRLVFAGLFGAWVALAAAITASGRLADVATILVLFTAPLVATAVLSLAVPAVRSALLAIPVPLVIGLNVLRVLGALFLALTVAGRLAGPFPFFAGIGDILTGAFALAIARIAVRESVSDRRVLAWNAFGTLDLVLAVVLGVTSQNGSPLQLIQAGAGSAAIVTLPWSMIPLVLVPLFLIGHVLVFAQARVRAEAELGRPQERGAARPGWTGA